MKVCITTIVTDNYYQLYLPLFIYVLRKEYPEYDVKTFIKGQISPQNQRALDILGEKYKYIKPKTIFKDVPEIKSTINCLRFLVPEKYFQKYEYVIFVDVDLLLYRTKPTLFDWHLRRLKKIGSCYAGHHGPIRKKYRPEISKAGWVGKFERVSGGFFMVNQKWFKKTKKARAHFMKKALQAKLGGYREADEVMLCNILKKSGLKVPPWGFKRILRGIHLGDFKPAMKKRYHSDKKLTKKIDPKCCKRFVEYNKDETWVKLIDTVCEEKHIKQVIVKAKKILKQRSRKKW